MKPPRYTFAAPITRPEPEETLTPWRFFIGVLVFFVAPFLYGFFS